MKKTTQGKFRKLIAGKPTDTRLKGTLRRGFNNPVREVFQPEIIYSMKEDFRRLEL